MSPTSPGTASQPCFITPLRPWRSELWAKDAETRLPSGDLIDLIYIHGQAVTIDRDEALFCEKDRADAVYVVIAGTVRCFKILPDGRRQIIRFHQPGSLLGLNLGDDCLYSAEGVTKVRLRRLGRARLEMLLEQRPQLRGQLVSIAIGELEAAQNQILLLGRKTARERVCSFLLERAASKQNKVELPMSRTDIADYLGLTIETVSRTFSQLRSEGLVHMACSNTLELTDLERLSEMADAA